MYDLFTMYVLYQLFWLVLRRNIVKVIWRFYSFIAGGRPQVPLRPLFHARAGTRVETPKFRMHCHTSKSPGILNVNERSTFVLPIFTFMSMGSVNVL